MDAQHQNVCLTFFLALVAMELLERYGNDIWEKLVLTAVFCTLTEAAGADGGAWGMGLVLAFYFCVIGNSGTNVPKHILFHEKTAGGVYEDDCRRPHRRVRVAGTPLGTGAHGCLFHVI